MTVTCSYHVRNLPCRVDDVCGEPVGSQTCLPHAENVGDMAGGAFFSSSWCFDSCSCSCGGGGGIINVNVMCSSAFHTTGHLSCLDSRSVLAYNMETNRTAKTHLVFAVQFLYICFCTFVMT